MIRAMYFRMEVRSVQVPTPEGKTGVWLTFQTPHGEQFGPTFRDTPENRELAKKWLTNTGHEIVD
jgi:hypothetical protein